jgi:hypothetical protein
MKGGEAMNNRITPYQAGWLSLLLEMRVADEKELREAQNRVAQEAVEELARRRRKRLKRRRRRDD